MRPFLLSTCTMLCAGFALSVQAASLTIKVTDNQGAALTQAVVALAPTSAQGKQLAQGMPLKKAQMAQRDRQFDPHVVAVQKGAQVAFPNEDNIKHQVYSLSDIKPFDLLVVQGESADGPVFDTLGQVSVGCNIHDWMLAYIYVVDTPYFASTNERGELTLDLPDGETFSFTLWHPQVVEQDVARTGMVDSKQGTLTIALQQDLLPGYDQSDDLDDFEDY